MISCDIKRNLFKQFIFVVLCDVTADAIVYERKTGIYGVCFFDQHFYIQFICQQAVSCVNCVAYHNDWKQKRKHQTRGQSG